MPYPSKPTKITATPYPYTPSKPITPYPMIPSKPTGTPYPKITSKPPSTPYPMIPIKPATPYPPFVPKPKPIPKPLMAGRIEAEPTEEKRKAYQSFIKERGKFKAFGKPTTKEEAFDLASEYVDRTP
jgi:hypothetical protein